jgi:peptidylprolyl isomerase
MQEVDLSGDGGVLKSVLRQGAGDTPPKGYEVHAYYTGILEDGSKFETKYNSRDGQLYKFTLGEGRVIKGWDVGFASMRKGERAMLTCRSDYAFGENGSPPTIPSGATLKFDIELIDFQEVSKEIWEMTETEKTTQAVVCKEHGTQSFKQKDFAGKHLLGTAIYFDR